MGEEIRLLRKPATQRPRRLVLHSDGYPMTAGVDPVWLFSFFYRPDDPQFKLLREAGDPKVLSRKNKTYVLRPADGTAPAVRVTFVRRTVLSGFKMTTGNSA